MPNDDLRYVFFTERRPRCPACGSADLHPYKTLPMEGDGSRTRYTLCRGCRHRFLLVIEPDDSFQQLENTQTH